MKHIIWIVVSCLLILSLVLVSCGKKEGQETVTSSDEPQYGGTLTIAMGGDATDFLP